MSGKAALRFRRLHLRRTPGIMTPFTIDGLCDGINITYGPNASGKTTTALALQMLLWPDTARWGRASLAGYLELQGSEWHIDIDSGQVTRRQDGSDGARLEIDAAESRDRYVLTLHDLLQAEDSDFANTILRESSGGYDVDAARQALGYERPSGRPTGNTRAYRNARDRTREARGDQQALLNQQTDLERLREELEAARQASIEVAALEKALVFHDRRRDLDRARQALEMLPANIDRLQGDELERLEDLRKRRSDYEERQRAVTLEIQQAEAEIAATRLADVDLPPGFVAGLRARVQQLQELASRLREAQNDAAEQLQRRDHAARQLGSAIEETQIRRLGSSGLRDLLTLAQRLQAARAEHREASTVRDWLGEGGPHGDVERLQQGISRLNAWLRSGDAPAAGSTSAAFIPALVAAGLIVLAALIAGIVGNPLLLALIVLAPIPVVVAYAMRPKASPSSPAGYVREEYARLGLEQPPTWDVEQVAALVDRLGRDLRQQQIEQERAQRWAGLETRWQEASTVLRDAYADWQQALQATGISTIEPEPAALFLLAQNVERWQQADADLTGARQREAGERQRYDTLLAELNDDLARAGCQASADHATAQGYIEDLDERSQRLREARQKLRNARNNRAQVIEPELERLDRERAGIFELLGLAPDDERTLADRLEQRESYLSAREGEEGARLALRHALAELGERAYLAERDEFELQTELDEARLRAERAEEVNRRIVEIETRIDQAKQARNLEQAIADEAAAAETLRADREEGYRLAAGWELAEFVRRQTRDRDRPKVFHRARELFVRMTQGRYVLQFDDSSRPAFLAEDTTTKVIHELDELSSATRVQLLMAVRMAFVEEMEQGPKLPLILDETLGNADEHRAEAIIRAVCEICRDGRQVFYFTAQHDEVGKWRRLLADHPDLPHHVISLAEARQLPEFEPTVLMDIPPSAPSVPAPNGLSHLAYRDVLHVPDIDLQAGAEAVHLWYVVDEPERLNRLLTLGISTWGQLKTLVDFGGHDLVSRDAFDRARARAGVIDAALRAYRVGRGRPVDRAAVLDSGKIRANLVDQVARLADRVSGEAKALIRALKARQVSGVGDVQIEDLRAYLIAAGYLDPEEPLPFRDIHVRVIGAASADLNTGLISREDVDFLLRCLPIWEADAPAQDAAESDGTTGGATEPTYRPRLPQINVRRQND